MSEDTPQPAPKKKKLGLVIGGVVALLAAVGGGLWASGMLGGGGEAEAAEAHGEAPAEGEAKAEGHGEAKAGGHGEAKAEGHGEAVGAEGAEAVGHGVAGTGTQITNVGAFTVNLRGSGGGRVLRMEVQLDSTEEAAAYLASRTPQLRDAIITAVSD